MKICVIGGGNIGTLLTAEFSFRGYDTYLYTKNTSQWDDSISVFDRNDNLLFVAHNYVVTSHLEKAVFNADYIWITYPAFMFAELAEQLLPLITKEQIIVCVPGSGGAEFSFSRIIEKGVQFCGLQRVHCITRIKEKGKSVYALGRKESVYLGAFPSNSSLVLSNKISDLLLLPCVPLPNYLCVTLTPSNPILHTSRIYSMFRNYGNDIFYDHNYLFYEEWNNEASEILFSCDDELQSICRFLNSFDLVSVISLKEHYDSYSVEALTKKISSIESFRGITSPMLLTEKGWIPDFNSRYFKSDFSFGLKVLIEIASMIGCAVPTMKLIWNWYVNLNPKEKENSFIMDKMGWKQLYKRK